MMDRFSPHRFKPILTVWGFMDSLTAQKQKLLRCSACQKIFFDTLTDGQESAKAEQTQAVGVRRYGRLVFAMEVKIP